jgi:hypothetical protein
MSMNRTLRGLTLSVSLFALSAGGAMAQGVIVNDPQHIGVSRQTLAVTRDILDNNRDALRTVNDILQAVKGDRRTEAQGSFAQAALGGGFSMAQAPNLGSMLSGGQFSFGGLSGDSIKLASTLINGLMLVKSLSGMAGSQSGSSDKVYGNAVSTAAAVTGLIAATQGATQSRVGQYQQAGGQIGQAKDIKGAIDQNTQIQLQNGLLLNEVIGQQNGILATLQAQRMQELTSDSEMAKMLGFDRKRSGFVGGAGSPSPMTPQQQPTSPTTIAGGNTLVRVLGN